MLHQSPLYIVRVCVTTIYYRTTNNFGHMRENLKGWGGPRFVFEIGIAPGSASACP